ncbi:MAG: Fe(3+) ABC transporter substrate-binding protein [Pseudomonadota bacterium]
MKILLLGLLLLAETTLAASINVYSGRNESLIKPLLDAFEQDTGIEVNLVTGSADTLINRLQLEGRNSPADLLLTVDVGRLHRAQEADLLAPVDSTVLAQVIPAQYRDPHGHWFGLSLRSRVLVYAPDRVDASRLSTYEALADPEWKGRICIRSSSNIYNQSLVASMIAADGVPATEAWARGLVANMARPPGGGDRDQIKAVAAGQCDLAVVNNYYLAGMLSSTDASERAMAQQVVLFWPNQEGRGAHVNVSGAGVTRAAKNRAEAVALLEYLVSESAQSWYAKTNHEYPVRADVENSELQKLWGAYKADSQSLPELGKFNEAAVRLMDRAGWK